MKYQFKPSHVIPAFLFVVAVLYGGSKPPATNRPTTLCGTGVSPVRNLEEQIPLFAFTSVTNWIARGAYCDWQRIDFPEAFRFPVGTNLVDAVTLFAWGEVRVKSKSRGAIERSEIAEGLREEWNLLTDSADQPERARFPFHEGAIALPARVSIEPNASSVTHGLTPSNSYRFAWHNCCANRSATNRVDASIELFRSGACTVRFGNIETFYPAPVPPEYPGIGQDEDWIRATFPDEADTILAQGYDNWLLNTWTGINVENGHCLVRVTIDPSAFNQSPIPTSQAPIYLSCGSYRVNVTQPGTYGFPTEVLTAYDVRTYPTPVPLTFEYDDGYRGEGGPSFEVVDRNHPAPTPRLMMAAPALNQPLTTNNQLLDCIYRLFVTPNIVVTPYSIALETAVNEELRFWCNVAHRASYTLAESSDEISLDIDGARAVIREVWCAGFYEVCESTYEEAVKGYFEIYGNSPTNENGYVTNRIDATIFSGESWHHEPLGDRRRSHHLTAVTQHGSTEPATVSMSQMMGEGVSAYVAVYMASSEPDSNPAYDDSVSWSITSNGSGSFSGSASVMDHWSALEGAESWENELYGVEYDPLFLGGQIFAAPSDDVLRLSLTASAQNATDGLRETCVQIVVYPTDANGNIIGLPTWVNQN